MNEKPPDSVVQFKRRKTNQLVLACPECDRQDFWINTDGTLECRGCSCLLKHKKWVETT